MANIVLDIIRLEIRVQQGGLYVLPPSLKGLLTSLFVQVT